jgi:ATP-binding cassette subfamily C exporter for protease/lipase
MPTDRLQGQDREARAYRAVLRRLRPGLAGAATVSAVLNILMLTGSIYMLQVYDRVLASGSVPTLVGLFAIVVVLYGFMAAYDALRARLLSRSGLRLDAELGAAGFRVLLGPQPGAGTDAQQPLRDIETMRGFLSGPLVGTLCDLPFVPLYLAVLFLVHPWLGWLTIGGSALAALLALVSQRLAGTAPSTLAERLLTEAAARQQETIRAMGMAPALLLRWRALRDRALARGQAGQERIEMLAAISRAFRLLLQSAILTLGAYLVIQGDMSGGMIIASSVLSGRALGPIDQIIGQWKGLARTREAHRRLLAASDLRISEPEAELDLPALRGEVQLSHVTRLAAAAPGLEPARILQDVSLTLCPGDVLAVLGPSGSGKSTLARLLVGAIRPDSGDLRLDGATPEQWDPARLGAWIGYLPQQVEMLPGTVRENIARFNPTMTDAAVIAAARQVGIHEMILALPEGYATVVGTPGTQALLSGGQMQRLGLARALCGKPALVVLDEPNANLDQAGDAALSAAIATLRAAGSTVVVMTHRANVLAEATKLLYLKDGRVAVFGPKDEILARAQRVAPPAAAAPRPAAPQPAANTALQKRAETRPEIRVLRRVEGAAGERHWRIGA